MGPVNLEKMDYENRCRELVSKVCSSVRGVVGPSFDGTYLKLEEFTNNDESNRLEGYSGFIVDFPTSKAEDYLIAMKKILIELKPDIKKLGAYPWQKVKAVSNETSSAVFVFQKNVGDFVRMTKLTPEEEAMLNYDHFKAIKEDEEEYGRRRHY